MSIQAALGDLWSSASIVADLDAICACGGRLAGTESEAAARQYLSDRLDEMDGQRSDFGFDYTGLLPDGADLWLESDAGRRDLEVTALPGSPPVGPVRLQVLDLGTGTELDFAAAGDQVVGRAVLVRHEYPFTTGHTHRRRKYALACEGGAAAFIIANNDLSGGLVSGGSGKGSAADIPAVGVTHSAGESLRSASVTGPAHVCLTVRSHAHTWRAQNLILDFPGATAEYVVLCAHIDGHNLADSAMDNATGLSAVLEVGRRLGPLVSSWKRGLRLALFNVEEWGLEGSRRYVRQLPDLERGRIAMAIALDSITGYPRLSALTGGNQQVEQLLHSYCVSSGVPIDIVRPRLANSDHHNFQQEGIPAMRLIAGYGREQSLTRYLLTTADRRSMVDEAQLKAAALTTACLVHAACS